MNVLRQTWLGIVLISAASLLLLLSDLDRRERVSSAGKKDGPVRFAVMQWASTGLLDDTVGGIVEGLRREGYVDGDTASIRFFNASGDPTTGNMMARELVNGGYDMILTASTLAMQAVAKANRDGRVMHVFGGVTDPYGSGVGISGPEPDQHPPHLLGVGTFQPVESSIRIAHQMNPKLKRIGVVWNSSEHNSEACVKVARAICKELDIELIEAIANNTSEVPEAVRSILGRGAEALWVGGDTVAIASISAIVSAGRAAGVPVFSNDPSDVKNGALFGLGASYEQVGIAVGELGGRILNGTDPTTIGVKNMVPEVLALNEEWADALPAWTISEALRRQAADTQQATAKKLPHDQDHYSVGILYIGPHAVFETAIVGIKQALAAAGFSEGENLTLLAAHANDDMSMLPQVIQRMVDQKPDLIMPLSTPCLAATLASVNEIPLVFGIVSAPLQVGAGESFEKHLPHVTGAVWTAPAPRAFEWIRTLFPNAAKLGLVYNPAHANSLVERDLIDALCQQNGLDLIERNVNTPADITSVLQSLLQAQPDVVFGMGDNTVVSSFPAIAQACRQANVPLVADDNSLMGSGALFSIGGSPLLEGRHAGQLAVRVLRGESPADIPFSPSVEVETAVDFKAASELGITFPAALLKETDIFHHLHRMANRPLRLAMIQLVENPLLTLAAKGVRRGLSEAGLQERVDVTFRAYNAQGEISQLPALIEAATQQNPDLILTLTTPAMLAAAKHIRDIPVVFCVASDPSALGAFDADTRPANMTGVHDDPPLGELLKMARTYLPTLSTVGILFDPAQPNAVLSAGKLRQACQEQDIALVEANASSISDLATGVQALIQRGAQTLILSADNLIAAGFPVIHRTAQRAKLPIFVTSVNLVDQGATGAVGDDYEAWGAQAGHLAASVLAGVSPTDLPLETTRKQIVRSPKAVSQQVLKRISSTPFEIRIIRYNDAVFSADTARGILDGFKQAGWQEGRDFNVRVLNAQGDVTTLSSIVNAVANDQPDIIMPISTPSLQATLRQAGDLPIVFSSVGDGVRAGAGESVSNHLPNVTGITTRSPFEGMAKLIRLMLPDAKTVGTLFTPAEVNSELYRHWFEEALAAHAIELVSVPVNATAETTEATTALLRLNPAIMAQISDNATRPGYANIIARAAAYNVPFFCFDSAGLKEGAALALARDFYHTGVEAAGVAIRVLQGVSPADIPFANTQTELLVINPDLLQRYNLALPTAYQKKARIY